MRRNGTWTDVEREAMVTTLRAADPEGPTLCEGWSVHRLLAHLVAREHHPQHTPRDVRARPGSEPGLSRVMASTTYSQLVDVFAGGPPAWSPFAWASETTNLVEYVVHHEDVRRAGADPAEPRVLPTDMVRALWDRLAGMGRFAYRRSPVGVVLVVPGGPRRVVRRGPDAVVVTGDPVELALHALGRDEAADVDVLGRPETVEQFLASR